MSERSSPRFWGPGIRAWARNSRGAGMAGAYFWTWARLKHRKSDTLIEDTMIAGTAVVHSLVVATRNVRDFEAFDTPTLNPFEKRDGSAGG